VTTSRAKNVES